MKKGKYISIALFCIYIAAVILLCVIQTDSLPELPKLFLGIPLDKVAHFMMFLPFPILGYMTFHHSGRSKWRDLVILGIICILGAGFALSTERLQAMTSYRSYEVADMIADFTGILTGVTAVIIYILIKKK